VASEYFHLSSLDWAWPYQVSYVPIFPKNAIQHERLSEAIKHKINMFSIMLNLTNIGWQLRMSGSFAIWFIYIISR